jgi:hypothetical protein
MDLLKVRFRWIYYSELTTSIHRHLSVNRRIVLPERTSVELSNGGDNMEETFGK